MKYLQSAVKSVSKMFFTYRELEYAKWLGIVCYTAAMLTLYLRDVCTYPGMSDIFVYIEWAKTTATTVLRATHIIWLLLNLINTVVTLTAIFILFR